MAKPERAVVTCMDYRVKESVILEKLNWPDAYIIRNAGGSVTEDVIRSLMLLQKFVLGGKYNIPIAVVAHTDCGMQTADGGEDQLRREIEKDIWICATPPFALETFLNPQLAVRRSIQRLRTSRFVSSRTPEGLTILGRVYDVLAPAPVLSEVKTHVVQPGQHWGAIALQYGISESTLRRANPQAIRSDDLLGVGQVLYIP